MYSPAPAVLARLLVKLQLSMVMFVANTDKDPYSVPKPLNWQLVTSRVPVTFAQTAVVRTTVRLVVGDKADSKMQLSKARALDAPAIVKQKGEQTTWESWMKMLSCREKAQVLQPTGVALASV